MQSKKSLPEITIVPPQMVKETSRFVSVNNLQQLPFWDQLSASKREQFKEDVKQLVAARSMHVASGLAMGKYFASIYNICEPYSGAFRKVANSFKFVERTAYRYMDTYNNVRERFPETIVKAMISQGIDITSHSKDKPLGKYTPIYGKLPPPANPDEAAAARYVTQFEDTYKQFKKEIRAAGGSSALVDRSKDEWLLINYRGIRNALKQLTPRQRRPFLDSLFGMALTEAGISSKVEFAPEAIPEEFRREVGRPPKEAEAEG